MWMSTKLRTQIEQIPLGEWKRITREDDRRYFGEDNYSVTGFYADVSDGRLYIVKKTQSVGNRFRRSYLWARKTKTSYTYTTGNSADQVYSSLKTRLKGSIHAQRNKRDKPRGT